MPINSTYIKSIQIENPGFDRHFNISEEFQKVLKLCDDTNKRRIEWLESLIIPVRTDNIDHFCKDFFLPGLFNHALKTKDLALKIFLIIMMPICDVLSFPIRLITVIPRCIYNAAHPKEAHLFYKYLINEGVAAEDLKDGHVHLTTKLMKDKQTIHQREETFNFMVLPATVSNGEFKKPFKIFLILDNFEPFQV